MNKERLLILTAYLDELDPDRFEFSEVVCADDTYSTKNHSCGSVGCAIGHTPNIWPDLVKFTAHGVKSVSVSGSVDYVYVAMELFDISHSQAYYLFTPALHGLGAKEKRLEADATPIQVAESIRNFVNIS